MLPVKHDRRDYLRNYYQVYQHRANRREREREREDKPARRLYKRRYFAAHPEIKAADRARRRLRMQDPAYRAFVYARDQASTIRRQERQAMFYEMAWGSITAGYATYADYAVAQPLHTLLWVRAMFDEYHPFVVQRCFDAIKQVAHPDCAMYKLVVPV